MNASLLAVSLLLAAPAFAQHFHQSAPHGAQGHAQHQHGSSVYAGMENRAIKALSKQQIDDIRAGKGMSLALPAELNGYPGPLHALELADALDLSEEQKIKIQELFAQMQMEAKRLGEQLITQEYELDRLFKDRKATLESVQQLAAKAALAHAELRTAHLNYHLKMTEVLTAKQVAKYNQLRGYR
ncbi:Spy/CpxP family protein refolding chaperone [Noviherbaspirillum sp. CPCC 100848]|uniref:Spy/CpxP family protein refolding chaperone n=1 Tax=Noviherbaspirillum album TaxID=3080276 RepID=A0ABU6JEP4_9BURK|nr:Spy/CpxP family protein refolding chaperone [Noviherbaspirillum sp. CPCC 100848]MEC4722124.1 Spy/CpxP family protein refolding chaperone [Noviherbaspirillum sp. CPCC 100848]